MFMELKYDILQSVQVVILDDFNKLAGSSS